MAEISASEQKLKKGVWGKIIFAREPSGSVLPARRGGLAAKIQRRDFP